MPILTPRNQLYSASRYQCVEGLQSCATGGTAARVTRARLSVITLEPLDGRRVRLISPDHIPLADWAINESVVIPQSAVCLLHWRARPRRAPSSKFLSSPQTSLAPLVSRWGSAAVIQQHIKPCRIFRTTIRPMWRHKEKISAATEDQSRSGKHKGEEKIANQD